MGEYDLNFGVNRFGVLEDPISNQERVAAEHHRDETEPFTQIKVNIVLNFPIAKLGHSIMFAIYCISKKNLFYHS